MFIFCKIAVTQKEFINTIPDWLFTNIIQKFAYGFIKNEG